jgi:uncharacterized protein
MRLLVSEIRAQHTLDESAELDSKILGSSDNQVRFTSPVKVDVQAQMTHENIVVLGKVSTQVQMTCGRCLTEYKSDLKGNFQDIFSFDQETIDLTELIREAVLVDVPLRGLCKEGCLGLCSVCGANKNTNPCKCKEKSDDPRLGALSQIRFK